MLISVTQVTGRRRIRLGPAHRRALVVAVGLAVVFSTSLAWGQAVITADQAQKQAKQDQDQRQNQAQGPGQAQSVGGADGATGSDSSAGAGAFAGSAELAPDPQAIDPGQSGVAAVLPSGVQELRQAVASHVNEKIAEPRTRLFQRLSHLTQQMPAHFKLPVRQAVAQDPWQAGQMLEQQGRAALAAASRGPEHTGELINALSLAIGKPAAKIKPAPIPEGMASLDDHLDFIVTQFDQARAHREAAIAGVEDQFRQFMVDWPASMLQSFRPQLPVNDQTRPLLNNDRSFLALMHQQVEWAHMVAASRVMAGLARAEFVASLTDASQADGVQPLAQHDWAGSITGSVLAIRQTPHGLIIVGGPDDNRYRIQQPVAMIIDLGGNDRYEAMVGASQSLTHPLGMVIDLAGNDQYAAGSFGLASGRLGVGLVFDLKGHDKYQLATASGGIGVGGIGVLVDAAGNDTYAGSAYTQGAAIGGIGALVDHQGDDTYTSDIYALGFGGTLGAGAVIDVAGNDSYQCGQKHPSPYNQTDSKNIGQDDERYQWQALGMGMGLGRRILSQTPQDHQYALAGGLGMLLDADGDDQYQSGNFSQGSGYYFGCGLKIDLRGNDKHHAARYGQASGAHFAMGVFVDGDGQDHYRSTGPTYNGGCAWDHSVFFCVDQGQSDDVYDFTLAEGLGRGQIHSLGAFGDFGGNDQYISNKQPPAFTDEHSVAVFFDGGGQDDYSGLKRGGDRFGNDKIFKHRGAGLVVDKP